MSGLLPELEGWVKVAGAAVAVLMAVLVPIRSWIVEDRRYRAQTLEAIAAASRAPLAAVRPGAHALADSLALGAVADALVEVADAIRQAPGAHRERDRLARAVEALLAGEAGDPVTERGTTPARAPTAPPGQPAG